MPNKRIIVSEKEAALLESLRERPELAERFDAIVQLTQADPEGRLKADDIEARLIEEVRRLGNSTMKHWAESARDELESRLLAGEAGIHRGKKKS